MSEVIHETATHKFWLETTEVYRSLVITDLEDNPISEEDEVSIPFIVLEQLQ